MKWFTFSLYLLPNLTQLVFRNEELCGDAVSKPFDVVVCRQHMDQIEETVATNPDMCQFMTKSKHSRRFRIGRIHEDQRCVGITEHKSTELYRVQRAMIIQPDDAIAEDENPASLGRRTKCTECVFPCGKLFRSIYR